MTSTGSTATRLRAWFGASGVCLVVSAGLIGLSGHSSAAMPARQSTQAACTTPEIVTLESIEQETGTPAASPAASPIAVDDATPIATDDLDDSTAPGVQGQIERTLKSIAVCQAERRVKTLTRYVTENFLSDVYAGGGKLTKDQFIILGRELPRIPVEIVSVSNVQVDADGNATADVVWTVSRQLFHAEWAFSFVPQSAGDETGEEAIEGYWLADGVTPLPVDVPEGANKVRVELDKSAYDPANIRVQGPDFIITAVNTSRLDHELLVLKLDDGVTTDALLRAPGAALPDGVTVIGQLTIPDRETGRLVLVGVEAGEYVVVDLLPDANGTPHLALGMKATLTVK